MAMTSSTWMMPPIVYDETIPSSQSASRMNAIVMSTFDSSVPVFLRRLQRDQSSDETMGLKQTLPPIPAAGTPKIAAG